MVMLAIDLFEKRLETRDRLGHEVELPESSKCTQDRSSDNIFAIENDSVLYHIILSRDESLTAGDSQMV
jgi:hypothetical protein